MQYTGSIKGIPVLDLTLPLAFIGGIQTRLMTLNTKRKRTTQSVAVQDNWPLINAAARAQNDFWARPLLP